MWRADLAVFVFVGDAHRIAADHALALQPIDPALHGGAREPEPARDIRGGGAGVLAQQGKQQLVGSGDLHHAA